MFHTYGSIFSPKIFASQNIGIYGISFAGISEVKFLARCTINELDWIGAQEIKPA